MRTKQLLIFFALWFVFAVALESTIVAFGWSRFFVTALMWSVGIAATLTLNSPDNRYRASAGAGALRAITGSRCCCRWSTEASPMAARPPLA